ncbi:5-formyltetrahydrofolate cyclo-ligase [Parapontixanthobacter aurantiacus]|uniref:5-formyltetrahydrofolate cyclo-ligase n=1 Tax=Parapontixanthobacter aurantiacus TaxID=1463599 RepID=UPI00301C3DB9
MTEQIVTDKADLRRSLRAKRKDHVAAIDDKVRALLLMRPPAAVTDLLEADDVIGLYHAMGDEAPTRAYAKHFQENGYRIALPYFAEENAAMEFREYTDPFADDDLESGPFDIPQPRSEAPLLDPDILFVPLIGFTEEGHRLGQGKGHYDRFLGANLVRQRIGLAWDAQLVAEMPVEQHDEPLDMIVTPTRLFGPFEKRAAR